MTSTLRSNIVSTVGISGIGFLVSFASQIVISYHFGTSAELDAYWAAFALMNLLAFPLTPLRDALVPEFYRRLRVDAKAASVYFSRAMTLILLISAMGTLVAWLLAEPLTTLAVSAKQPQVRVLAMGQLYWLAPAILVLAFSETLNSIMASYHRVVMQAFARLLGMTAMLAVLALFSGILQTRVLPLSVIAAQATIALVQVVVLRREGLVFKPAWPSDLGERFMAVSGALLATYAASQVYAVFEKHTLTSFSAGLVSSFQYSVALTNVLITLVGVSLSNVLWPRFLDHAAREEKSLLYEDVSVAVRLALLVMGWLCALVWINANALIELVYARGAFDALAVVRTADALRVAVFAAVPISVGLLMGRALIALGAARSVMVVGLATTFVGCAVLVAARLLGNPDLALSHWLVANLAGVVIYILLLARVCGVQNGHGKTLWWVVRWLVVLLLAGTVNQVIPEAKPGHFALVIDVFLRTTVFSALFIILAWFTGMFRGLPLLWRR
jgi:putative peptidoglycan lipid II flippase